MTNGFGSHLYSSQKFDMAVMYKALFDKIERTARASQIEKGQ